MTTMFIYEGLTCRGYDDYVTICSSVSASLFYIRRHMTLAVAAEHMQDESIHGYTCSDHCLRMYITQRDDVLAYMKNVGWKEDWICHQL